jgi:hypothetical protein
MTVVVRKICRNLSDDLAQLCWRTHISDSVLNLWLLNFSNKVFKKLPLCVTIPHVKSYLNISNGNQDIDNLRFLVFLTAHGYFMIFDYANLTVHSLFCIRNLNVSEFLCYLF